MTGTNAPLRPDSAVDRARDHFLAGAALALDQHRDLRRRDLPDAASSSACHAGISVTRPGSAVVGRELEQRRRVGLDRHALEEAEQRVAELDQRAVGEHRALGRVAVDDRAVLRLGVDQHPAAEARLDPRVLATTSTCRARGSCSSVPARLGAPLGAAAERRRRSARSADSAPSRRAAGRTRARAPAPAPAADRSVRLAIRVDSSGSCRARHPRRRILTRDRGSTMSDPLRYRRDVGDLRLSFAARTAARPAPGTQRDRAGTSAGCALEAQRTPAARDRRVPRAPSPGGRTSPTRTTTSAACSTIAASSRDAEALLPARDLRSTPEVALYWFNLGVVARGPGPRAPRRSPRTSSALALDPQLADAHFNLARQLEHRARAAETSCSCAARCATCASIATSPARRVRASSGRPR